MAQSLEELVRQSGDLLKEVDWNDLLAVVGAIVEGTATVHVDPGDSLPDAVAKLPADGGELALRAGTYELPAPLEITGRSRISLTGAGPSTVVRCATSEAAITLTDCHETTLSRLRVEGGTAAADAAKHINGAVTVLGGADVTLSECTLACPDGANPRAQACLTARGGTDRLRADRCRFEIGAFQTGALIVDPVSVTLERNQASLRPGAAGGSVADAGIVVGGASVGTVRVLDNVIDTVTRGIHVGVSRRGAEGDPPVAADVVLISGNVITLFIPAGYKRDRHAVFVGNATSISILDTVATVQRPLAHLVGPVVRLPWGRSCTRRRSSPAPRPSRASASTAASGRSCSCAGPACATSTWACGSCRSPRRASPPGSSRTRWPTAPPRASTRPRPSSRSATGRRRSCSSRGCRPTCC